MVNLRFSIYLQQLLSEVLGNETPNYVKILFPQPNDCVEACRSTLVIKKQARVVRGSYFNSYTS